MKKSRKIKIMQILILMLVIVIVTAVIIDLFPVIKNLSTPKGQLDFKNYVQNTSVLGFLTITFLQVAQIILAVLPGEPLEVLAGMCYGPIWGTIFIMATASLSSLGIFFLVRRYGKTFIYNFCDKKKVDKLLNSNFLKDQKRVEFVLFLLFFLPATPKDLIAYISGLLPVKIRNYILIALFARFPSVISSTLVGANIIEGNIKISIIIYLITFAFIVFVALIINLFDKQKTTTKILKEVK